MSLTKLAAFRYRVLNELFRNNPAGMNIHELKRRVSDKLMDTYGIPGVSERTIKADIQAMREDPPSGFAAPIVITYGTGLYRYKDPNFTIFNSLTEKDRTNIGNAIQILSQFTELPHFSYLEETLLRLEGSIENSEQTKIVYFDHEPNAKGGHWVAPLIDYIRSDRVLSIDYLPFDSPVPLSKRIHPYFIKKYRTRWYLIGYSETDKRLENLGLDRIEHIAVTNGVRSLKHMPDPETYYEDIIGVTHINKIQPERITILASKIIAPYLEALPLHQSRRRTGKVDEKVQFELCVKPNQELESAILRYAEHIEILEPAALRQKITARAEKLWALYNDKGD